MSNFKPILVTVLCIFVVGLFLNIFISPFVDSTGVVEDSILEGFIDFIEDGWTISIPVIGEITMSPVTWFWFGIDAVTDFVVEQLTLLTYIPDTIALILIIIGILAMAFSVVTIIR